MTMNYDKVVAYHGTYSTPNNNDVLLVVPTKSHDFIVTRLLVNVRTAGAQAAGALVIETYAGSPVAIDTLTVGTSAQYTQLELIVDADTREQAGGTPIAVTWSTTDASAIGDFTLFMTDPSR